MDLELGGSYQRGTIVETHKSDQSGEGTLSCLIQDIYTENKMWMENTNLNESWHRIILFLQAKCVCVCVCASRLPEGYILVMPQLSNSQDGKIALHLLFGWSLDKDKKSLDQSKQFS